MVGGRGGWVEGSGELVAPPSANVGVFLLLFFSVLLLFFVTGFIYIYIERERERERITKSKHVLVWKPLLQIFAQIGAFSRPVRSA